MRLSEPWLWVKSRMCPASLALSTFSSLRGWTQKALTNAGAGAAATATTGITSSHRRNGTVAPLVRRRQNPPDGIGERVRAVQGKPVTVSGVGDRGVEE